MSSKQDSERTSRIPGFYKQSVDDRLAHVKSFANLLDSEIETLRGHDPAKLKIADKMIENVAGIFDLPVGIAANFRVDDRDYLLPMVIEEPSVVAAASNAAKLLRNGHGVLTSASEPWMIGQIQLLDVDDPNGAKNRLESASARLLSEANASQPRLVSRGGGAREVSVRVFNESHVGAMVVVHLMVDVCDAMGANLVNSMVETLAPICEELSGGRACLRILSNLADRRLVHAEGRIPLDWLARPDLGYSGYDVAKRIEEASVFAEIDPYRAATHNKGMMNGIDAFLIATGQDWRAVEAGIHAYGAKDGTYSALASWRVQGDTLQGRVTLPMQVGTVGGVTKVHPVVKVLLKLVGAESASHIGRLAAAVGLAQNLAAIMALATEGIQRGHMSLHARNIAVTAGASDRDIDRIVREMIRRKTINVDAAQSILREEEADLSVSLKAADFVQLRETHWSSVQDYIANYVSRDASTGTLDDMMWYQLGTGGKRVRAVIPMAIAEAVGTNVDEMIPFCASMELLHNATLVHADAQSRDRRRRGHATLWVRYGLDQAINCGDGLLCVAQECLEGLNTSPHVLNRIRGQVSSHLLQIIRAQVNERVQESSDPSQWLEIARNRVGGLFKLAVLGSSLLVDLDTPNDGSLEEIGGHYGVIFMIQDELLDLLGATKGALRGQSIREGKVTGLLNHFLHNADSESRDRVWTIFCRTSAETSDEDVAEVLDAMERQGTFRYAVDLIREQQEQVRAKSTTLDAKFMNALTSITEVFLKPLLDRLEP